MPRPFVAAQALVLVLSLAVAPLAARCDTILTAADDPAMTAAIETARSHLDRVLNLAIPDTGIAHPALTLKVAFPVATDETGQEVIWVAGVARTPSGMTGTLANEPLYMPDHQAGDVVAFDQDMIADWGLAGPSGRLFGHFTTRVLIATLPDDQAAAIREMLSDSPLPAAWR